MTWRRGLKRFALALVVADIRCSRHAMAEGRTRRTLESRVRDISTAIGCVRHRRDPACMLPRSRRD
jgi:hypothetical protein